MTTPAAASHPAALEPLPHDDRATAFGHPRGLATLLLTEVWAQFSYYGMRALLIYYMISTLGFTQPAASMVYASYIAAAWFTPIIGGIITDRLLGRRKAVALGSAIMALGHFTLGFEAAFYVALALIAIGNGLYVPSLASQIGGLYRAGDRRRKSAFSIYYMGGNVGAFAAPLACGYLGETFGWHWGFGLAGIGMLLGLGIYLAGDRHLVEYCASDPEAERHEGQSCDSRHRLTLLLAVLAVVILFRGAYEQLGNTVALWVADVDRTVGDVSIPMTWFQSLNGLFVIALTPLLLAWWNRSLAETATAGRMATGAALTAAAYLLAAMLTQVASWTGEPTPWPWLVLFFMLVTTGELYILPVGLSLFGRLAPRRIATTVMALWFAAISAGSLLSGALGALWSQVPRPLFFTMIAAVAGAAALLCLALVPWVRRIEQRYEGHGGMA